MQRGCFLKESGQTVVEYMLLIAVSVLLGIAVTRSLNDYFLNNPDSFMNRELNRLRGSFDGSDRYQRFPLRLPR